MITLKNIFKLIVITLTLNSNGQINAMRKGHANPRGAAATAASSAPKTLPQSQLYQAVGRNDIVEVTRLLAQSNTNINQKNQDLINYTVVTDLTALHKAIMMGNIQIIALLLERGATINAKDYQNFTPLHMAVSHDETLLLATRTAIVQLLLTNNADINAQNINGNTALHMAAKNNLIEIVKLLLEKGADLRIRNTFKETPFDYARDNQAITTIIKNHITQARLMRELEPKIALLEKEYQRERRSIQTAEEQEHNELRRQMKKGPSQLAAAGAISSSITDNPSLPPAAAANGNALDQIDSISTTSNSPTQLKNHMTGDTSQATAVALSEDILDEALSLSSNSSGRTNSTKRTDHFSMKKLHLAAHAIKTKQNLQSFAALSRFEANEATSRADIWAEWAEYFPTNFSGDTSPKKKQTSSSSSAATVDQPSEPCDVTLRFGPASEIRTIGIDKHQTSNITITNTKKLKLLAKAFAELEDPDNETAQFLNLPQNLFSFSRRSNLGAFAIDKLQAKTEDLTDDEILHAYSTSYLLQVLLHGQAYLCLPADPTDNNIKLNIIAPITHIDGKEVIGLWHTLSFCSDPNDDPIQASSVASQTKIYPNTCVHCFMGPHPDKITYTESRKTYFTIGIPITININTNNEISFSLRKDHFKMAYHALQNAKKQQASGTAQTAGNNDDDDE